MHEPPRLLAMSVSDDGSNAFGEPKHDDTRTADLCAMLGRWKVAVAFAVSLWSGCDFAIGASTLVASRRRLADHPVRYGTYNGLHQHLTRELENRILTIPDEGLHL